MLVHLSGARSSVVVDLAGGVPAIRHWGAPLGDAVDLDALALATTRPIAGGGLDVEPLISLVPEHGSGFDGRPGLAGHRRGGRTWSPRFQYVSHGVTEDSPAGSTLTSVAVDEVAQLRLETRLSLGDALRVQLKLTNLSETARYLLDRLDTTLPLPAQARELLYFTGRWARELHPQRAPFDAGAYTAENRRGRTSHQHVPLLFAGTQSFGEWSGEVWGAHLAWSGNSQVLAEVLPDGRRYLQLGELFQPGELVIDSGESYVAPEVVATYSADGLTPASWSFHSAVREHLTATTPRPVLLNTWEAVYFDHDIDRLRQLAEVAAEVGIERFVLDDGWFGGRRDDRRGLGDWWVSPEMYPDGLTPLVDHVTGLGMQFGIWVEPEMVNPDSELYRAHPEWALVTDGYEPVLGRHQLVLDLARPDAYAHILDALDRLLADHDIAYVKWDMNRDHVQGSGANGVAGTHAQTQALYRLIDELRARHPSVEIESCSSGGARIDHEILRRTDRVWTSDCNDALERQTIQRGASMFIPPEVMGAHIGPRRSHTTRRTHTLGFRAATAMFGHLGVEWNILRLDEAERADLAAVIAIHKRFRPLLHGGDTVRFDERDDGCLAHGVYSVTRDEALICVARLTTAMSLTPSPLRLPGLEPEISYRVERIELPDDDFHHRPVRIDMPWLADGVVLRGRDLAIVGLQLPVMNPESAIVLHLAATSLPS